MQSREHLFPNKRQFSSKGICSFSFVSFSRFTPLLPINTVYSFLHQVKDGHRVDLTAILKGLTVHCKEETSDMYTSIDAAASALSSKLRKYRARRMEGWHAGNKMGEDLMNALEVAGLDEETDITAKVSLEERNEAFSRIGDFIDPEAPNIMKVNSFDLEHAISVKEAIFALDYVDHDFFVFKNEETGKPTVIYKRNAGGIGLIECA